MNFVLANELEPYWLPPDTNCFWRTMLLPFPNEKLLSIDLRLNMGLISIANLFVGLT